MSAVLVTRDCARRCCDSSGGNPLTRQLAERAEVPLATHGGADETGGYFFALLERYSTEASPYDHVIRGADHCQRLWIKRSRIDWKFQNLRHWHCSDAVQAEAPLGLSGRPSGHYRSWDRSVCSSKCPCVQGGLVTELNRTTQISGTHARAGLLEEITRRAD